MPIILLVETQHIVLWKDIILGNLLTKYRAGMTEDDFMKDYPSANLTVVKKAVLELVTEGKVTIQP